MDSCLCSFPARFLLVASRLLGLAVLQRSDKWPGTETPLLRRTAVQDEITKRGHNPGVKSPTSRAVAVLSMLPAAEEGAEVRAAPDQG